MLALSVVLFLASVGMLFREFFNELNCSVHILSGQHTKVAVDGVDN